MTGIHTSDRAMVYTACPVFLYGGKSDNPLPPLTKHQQKSSRVKVTGRALRLLGLRGGGDYLGSGCGRHRAGERWRRWRSRRSLRLRRSPRSTPPSTAEGSPAASPARGEVVASLFGNLLAAARVLQGKLALTTRSCAVSTSAFHCLDGPHLGNLARYSAGPSR